MIRHAVQNLKVLVGHAASVPVLPARWQRAEHAGSVPVLQHAGGGTVEPRDFSRR